MKATMDPPEAPEHSPIDPRFEARRLAVARAAGRRRLRGALVAALIVVLMAGSYLAVRAPFLSVDRVDVSGAVYTDPVAIQAAVNSAMGQPMLTLDTGAITRLLESQAWVRQARVERDWPRGVRIEVAERVPLAVYGATDGRWRVVDDEGRVLAVTTGRPVDYVLLAGQGPPVPPGELVPEAIAGAVRVARALPPSLRARTYEVAFDAAGNLELHLQPRGTVLLGPPDALRDKLVAALTVLERTNPATLGVLDVRAPAKPVTTPITSPLTGGAP